MPWTLGKLTEEVLKLKNAVPLTFNWYTGRTQPPVEQTQIVFWEDVDNDIAKILMRRGGKTYIFTSYLQPPGGGPTISVANHAHRHATSGSSLVDVGADPIAPYNFAWTGIHSWSPSSNSTPVTINKTASITSSDLLRVNDTDGSYFFIVDISGLVGINTDPDSMLTIQGIAALSPPIASPLAWWYADSITPVSNGTAVTTWADSSGNGHTLTGAGIQGNGSASTALPAYYAAGHTRAAPNLPAVSLDSFGSAFNDYAYFTMAGAPLSLTAAAGWTIAFIWRDWSSQSSAYIIGGNSTGGDLSDSVVRAISGGSSVQQWIGSTGGVDAPFSNSYSPHTDGNDLETTVLRCDDSAGTNSSGLGNALRCWIDGNLVASTGHSGGPYTKTTNLAFRYLGTWEFGGNWSGVLGKSICEMIVYNRALTDAEVATVNTYLLNRVAGTLPVTGAYDFIRMKDGTSGNTLSRFDELGFLGIGADPSYPIDVVKAVTTQQRLAYDTSNYLTVSVGSTGIVTFDAVGAGHQFVFPDPVLDTSYFDLRTIATPANPPAGDARLYAKTGGFSAATLWLKDSNGADAEVITTNYADFPSGLVTLTPIAGSLTTYMRSDAAPALDQSIEPTWTGDHEFTQTTLFDALTTHLAGIDLSSSGVFPGPNIRGSAGDGVGNADFWFKSGTTWSAALPDRFFLRVDDVSGSIQFAVAANGQVAILPVGGISNSMFQVCSAGVNFPGSVQIGMNFTGKWTTTTPITIAGVSNAVIAAQFEGADGPSTTATGMLGAYFAGMTTPANRAHAVIAGGIFRPWDGNLTNNNNAHGSIYGAWIRQAGGSLGTNNSATDAFGLKIENVLLNSKPTLSGTQYGISIDEQVNTAAAKYGIFLANATAGYKAIAIRDADVWIGSNAAGELSLNGTTFNMVFYDNEIVSYDDDLVVY